MSQRRYKKDLSIMDNVSSLSDQELRATLKKYDVAPGPITDSTRNLYRNKLASLIEEADAGHIESSGSKLSADHQKSNAPIEEEDDDDTSDEDFEVQEEELEDEDEEYDDDEEDEEEDLMSELQDEDATLSRINNSGFGDITTQTDDPEATRVSRGLLIFMASFFVVIFGVYLVSRNNSQLFESLKPVTRWLLLALILTPFGYIAYKTHRFYRNRRNEESRKVCHLVSQSLALLQSPDNPKGMMPILHIRDTLLTPAERKAKQMNVLWQKAVKFVEEHESRVKVELVNIDGEDFRAWKWIGVRKV